MCICRNYEKGTIIKIRCKDFMVHTCYCPIRLRAFAQFHTIQDFKACTNLDSRCTLQTYKEATFRPSPRLNLILAPNGQLRVLIVCLQTRKYLCRLSWTLYRPFRTLIAPVQALERAHSHVPWPWALQPTQR